jgi:predicted small lipoprotein YifL
MRVVGMVVLAVLALALTACGSGGDSDSTTPESAQDAGTTQTRPEEEQHGATGASDPQLDLGNDEPAPPPTESQRKKERDLPQGAPKPKVDLKPVERQIFESSRYFCRQAGVEGMRREYGIDSTKPEDIAREAARRTYGRGGADAVYSGCLAGLRQAKQP